MGRAALAMAVFAVCVGAASGKDLEQASFARVFGSAARFKTFTRRIPIRIDNMAGPWRDDWADDLKDLAAGLHKSASVALGPAEAVPYQFDTSRP